MSTPDPISRLSIPPEKKSGRKGIALLPLWIILLVIGALLVLLRSNDAQPRDNGLTHSPQPIVPAPPPASAGPGPGRPAGLIATGYIIPRERIELTAKFPSTVQSINVRKGDRVSRGQVLVQMVDSTYTALVTEAQGRLALALAHRNHAGTNFLRQTNLKRTGSGTDQDLDDARRAIEVSNAEVQIAQGQLALAETHLSWCSIRSPIDGVVLEKLAEADELVIPQGYGGPDRPVTTLLAVADLSHLQVEVDINELDVPKVRVDQKCRVSPEAYPDRSYSGTVAEIAPEADRVKGTLQIKVQIHEPDAFLTPDLNARVEFLP